MPKSILFFADRLPPFIGGMEMHAGYFIDYFKRHPSLPLVGVVTKDKQGGDCLLMQKDFVFTSLQQLKERFDPSFVFFNSGRWIQKLAQLRQLFPKAIFLYRTGGNEIVKASLEDSTIAAHAHRQQYWIQTLNHAIDCMITNSSYTENRLKELGLKCFVKRFVGGVNANALRKAGPLAPSPFSIFCAARFVPYKNHALLLSVARQLTLRGCHFKLKLAGDGPFLEMAKEQTRSDNLQHVVEFLGPLDNESVCREMAHSHLYIQLSSDQLVEVPGGSYIHTEGMGRSILEAISAGTFVIARKCGALDEIVTASRGILVDLDRSDAIADVLHRAIKNPHKPNPWSDQYDWSNIFKQYEELLEELDAGLARYRKV